MFLHDGDRLSMLLYYISARDPGTGNLEKSLSYVIILFLRVI